MKNWFYAILVSLLLNAPAAAQVPADMLDISAAQVYGIDFRQWTPTVAVTNVELSARDGVRLVFDRPAMNRRWPDVLNWPPDGYLQWTLGACVRVVGAWHCAPMHEFWSDRNGPPRVWSGAHPLTLTEDGTRNNWQGNWAYDGRWGAMQSYVPKAGDDIAFFALAGAVRPGTSDKVTVRERSNIVVGSLTLNGFLPASAASGPGAPSVPPAPPASTVPDWQPRMTAVETALALLAARLTAVEPIANGAVQWDQTQELLAPLTDTIIALTQRVTVLESRVVPVTCRVQANLGAFRLPLSCQLQ